jgi:hypothetical protein
MLHRAKTVPLPIGRGQFTERLFNLLKTIKMKNPSEDTGIPKDVPLIRRYLIPGSRQFSNYWWGTAIFFGGLGFVITGVSSFIKVDTLPFLSSRNIAFFPQGLVMCFYGILGLLFSSYLWFAVFWGVGSGFNEFNKKAEFVRIFRWGFPGKNRRIDITYKMEIVEAIRVEIREGISPAQTIYMRIKGNRDIPLTRLGQQITLEEMETEAAELARFIQIPLELAS